VDAARGAVPRQSWPVLEAARADPKVIDDNRFNNITRQHTRGGFKRMVRSMPNGSAPGGSGLSYAELKCMSEKVLDEIRPEISYMCNISTQIGVVLSDWCR
jgi:hypothetical protein